MRVRLSSATCSLRKRSSRWPPSPSATIRVIARTSLCAALARSTAADSGFIGIQVSRREARSLLCGNYRRSSHRAGSLCAASQHPCPANDERQAHHLHQRKSSVQKERAARIPAHKFNQPTLNSVKHQKRGEYLAAKSLSSRQPHQNQEIQEFRTSLVQLRRMQR